ncbi:N,N-dimethylformamidase beta subunit family domain-containing protein [Mangrovicoccus sp. HB161399]|uniref:N,N-dimethylformamidase beta subunit family domain-containing protein n=1 Tax=Mangrovicoccus sp. HB161399 TaxID=2720392 RepID=UPI0015546D67|nr:N,N-dimethylformamidase beta subunit family domain-containing protein [Mangrovicoccus sp. HB161399]
MLKITGYPDRLSAAAGETVNFMVSLEEGERFDARLVRVIHGDCNPEGPGLKFRHVPSNADGSHPGGPQRIDAGSYMSAPSVPAATGPFTFYTMIWPTLLRLGNQTIAAQWDEASQSGWRVAMEKGGAVSVTLGGPGGVKTLTGSRPMVERQWYALCIHVDPVSGLAVLDQAPVVPYALADDTVSVQAQLVPAAPVPGLAMAGLAMPDGTVGAHFDGKIDGPALIAGRHGPDLHDRMMTRPGDPSLRRAVIAQYDFSKKIDTPEAVDIGPFARHGRLENLPTRGMKGWNWTGESHSWREKPEHYGAVHFHSDDVYDAGWTPSVALELPADLPSGPYALHVSCGPSDREATREDYLSFFVTPPKGAKRGERPRLLFLAPTCSYMAYANHGEHITARGVELQMNRMVHFGHSDLYMYDHPELGGSLYDTHLDGSGVAYSSRLRPILNFTAQYHSWLGGHGSAVYQYNADTHLFDWLEQMGYDYDVITDEDLHEGGLDLLAPYDVVMTGTHPEYHSTRMWDAMKAWIDRGGRLMYMGGNGWYWRVAFSDHYPGAIELRRAEDGIRPWISEPGEYYHSFTGEYGGLWRRIGRAPNVMAGVGFVAQGFDFSSYYRRAPDADNPRAAFIFEGVPDEIIGDFGLVGGGAAGIELDCINTDLGSPPNMLRLATSELHGSMMLLVNEEFGVVPPALGGDQNMQVRADMAFGETPAGGAIFATASIAWCGSLSHNGYDNNVSRITGNVLKRFLDPAPFPTAPLGKDGQA